MPVILPHTPGLPAYTYRCALEGVTYLWRWRWLERPSAWYMDIATDAGAPIRRGIRLLAGWPLLYRLRHPDRPPGELFITGPAEPLTLASLGRTHRLYYMTLADQAALSTAPASAEAVTVEVLP
jgi:hypothetical protein